MLSFSSARKVLLSPVLQAGKLSLEGHGDLPKVICLVSCSQIYLESESVSCVSSRVSPTTHVPKSSALVSGAPSSYRLVRAWPQVSEKSLETFLSVVLGLVLAFPTLSTAPCSTWCPFEVDSEEIVCPPTSPRISPPPRGIFA